MSEDTEGRPKARATEWIDRRDFVGLVGVALVGVGCWWISPPLGLIVPGAILAGVAIFGVRN